MSWSRTQTLELGCLGLNLSAVLSQWSDFGQSASLPVPQFPHYEMGGRGSSLVAGGGES